MRAEETSLISLEALQMKSSCSTSSATERIYGSTPLAVLVVVSRDIFGSQFTTMTELSATKKSYAAIKNLPMNMPNPETIVPNENIILNSISALGLEQNNSFQENKNSECVKLIGHVTMENMRKITKSKQRNKKQQL